MDNCFCDSNFFWFPISINNRGLFTWVWGTPGRWGNLLRWDKKKTTLLYMHYWMVTKHVNKKNAGKPHTMFWWLMLFYTHLRLLLKPSELWLSIATFNNHEKPPPKWILREFWCITNPTPAMGVTLPWEGNPVCQTGLPALTGHPTYHVNMIKLKWEII